MADRKKVSQLRRATGEASGEGATARQLRLRLEGLERERRGGCDRVGCMDAVAELRRHVVESGYVWSEGATRDGMQFMFGVLIDGNPVRWYVSTADEAQALSREVQALLQP